MPSSPSKDKSDIETVTVSVTADDAASSVDNASDDVKLAVDLIYLFESNEIDPQIALSALEIVKGDLERKLKVR